MFKNTLDPCCAVWPRTRGVSFAESLLDMRLSPHPRPAESGSAH